MARAAATDNNVLMIALAGGALYAAYTLAKTPPAGLENVASSGAVGAIVTGLDMTKPRGIRNRNPGNIKFSSGNNWLGQIGRDSGGFVVFDTDAHGLRAMAKLLKNYITAKGLNTVRKIVARWSPDVNGLNGNYAKGVQTYAGVDPDAVVVATDNAKLAAIMKGMIAVENGAAYKDAFQIGVLQAAAASV